MRAGAGGAQGRRLPLRRDLGNITRGDVGGVHVARRINRNPIRLAVGAPGAAGFPSGRRRRTRRRERTPRHPQHCRTTRDPPPHTTSEPSHQLMLSTIDYETLGKPVGGYGNET